MNLRREWESKFFDRDTDLLLKARIRESCVIEDMFVHTYMALIDAKKQAEGVTEEGDE